MPPARVQYAGVHENDLSDAEWKFLTPHLPDEHGGDRVLTHSVSSSTRCSLCCARVARDAGVLWAVYPADFPPWQTVYSHFRRLRLNGT